MKRSHTKSGFTMVEMMVAMAVTIGIILVLNEIIRTVQIGVSTGLGLSSVIENSRAISEQFAIDTSLIIPSASNGVLVIINKEVSAKYTEEDPNPVTLRADGIMFIRSKGDLESMTPSSNLSFAGSTAAMEPFVKVCYGHGVHSNADGSSNATTLGQAGTPDEYAANWVFTRHAMFFQPGSTTIHAKGGWYDAATTHASYTGPSPQAIYMGALDVAKIGLTTIDAENGAMMGVLAAGATGANVAKRLFVDDNAATYAGKALNYTFAAERIRVNTSPINSYAAGSVAQMHALLAEHVAEFAVSFAGDYDATPGVDKNTSPAAMNGTIKWYDMSTPPPTTAGVGFSGVAPNPISHSGGGTHSDRAFVFRHGSGNTRWPQMIRIRYRIVDPQGRLSDTDGGAGRVFEQIVRIAN